MDPELLAALVLAAHLLVIGFNLFGLVAIPLGAWRGWDWVRIRWWRWLHVASWATVAVQATAGRACFLTIWQDDLERGGETTPMVARWVNGLLYYDLPLWAFAAAYVLLFAYVLALLRLVPVRRRRRAASMG
jgi:hypothetical protein